METIYSKKNHQEINTSVLFKSSEFKESVMKESAEKFALISQTTRYMPEIVLNGNSINIISFFDKMKELYFSDRSIKNITDMSSSSSFFNTEAQEFNLEVAEKEIKESDIFKAWEEYPVNLVSFLTPLYHMGYFLLLAEISNNKDLKNKLKNRASSFLRSYYNLEEYKAIIAQKGDTKVNIKSLTFTELIAQWMSFINSFLSDFSVYLIKSKQKVTYENKDEVVLNFKNLMKDIKPKSLNINEEILTYLK
jgi:riboflavin synthase alpha subunit